MTRMRVALCQTNSGEDVSANEQEVFALLEGAASGGADLAALPEVWPCQGSSAQVRAAAEPIPGSRTERLSEVCLLYTSPSPRDRQKSRMPSSA